jgi:hypothetical protein
MDSTGSVHVSRIPSMTWRFSQGNNATGRDRKENPAHHLPPPFPSLGIAFAQQAFSEEYGEADAKEG